MHCSEFRESGSVLQTELPFAWYRSASLPGHVSRALKRESIEQIYYKAWLATSIADGGGFATL